MYNKIHYLYPTPSSKIVKSDCAKREPFITVSNSALRYLGQKRIFKPTADNHCEPHRVWNFANYQTNSLINPTEVIVVCRVQGFTSMKYFVNLQACMYYT